ncbi:MAG: rhodanese-like domain-containing protein [Bdellovibrionales bacterium]|nr:rhodanese-like domain-containing protein [Bdellovibrionales bacterium]
MNWPLVLILASLGAFFLVYYLRHRGERSDEQLNEHWQRIQQGALILDVRTAQEFSQGHIEGALNIPHNEIEQRIAELGPDKSRIVVAYCAVGGRSEKAKQQLLAHGFKQVYNAGGYIDLLNSKS